MDIRRRPPNPTIKVDNLAYSIPHKDSEAKNILEEIVWYKDTEINNYKKIFSLEDLRKKLDKLPPTKGFFQNLCEANNKLGIIAEIKKASPSKGIIRKSFTPKEIAVSYEKSGASCISVLTDSKFFQGGFDILEDVRKVTKLPLLCKDFIISAYQVYKARVCGADAILLIAAILNDNDLVYLKKIADNLDMTVLIEVHNEVELERILKLERFNLIGINNRNLKTFQTNLDITINLMNKYREVIKDENIIFISESGIKTNKDLTLLKSCGVRGVLIGETLMSEKDIEHGFKKLISNH